MKKLLCGCGIVLLICGIVMFLIANNRQKELAPQEVQTGYISNGKFVETDRGYIGGNVEGQESMGVLKVVGISAAVGGAVMLLVSYVIREDDYYMG